MNARALARLAAVPAPALARRPAVVKGVEDSLAYLASDEAHRSLARDPYWPKWHSPWWHMLLVHDLGETERIPARAAAGMAAAMDSRLHLFPIHASDAPGADLSRDVLCHCALGAMVPLLAASGVDVDTALPWVKPWFLRYQMTDGGLNCDDSAYRQSAECPSSMVATVAALEAMLAAGPHTRAERQFVDRAAGWLVERGLTRGSPTVHNRDERQAALAWGALADPRFYFYDVLRGLAALVRWAEVREMPLPFDAIAPVVDGLVARWPDGVVCVERQPHVGLTTLLPAGTGSPDAREPASTFPLLEAVSVIGAPSERLTRQWSETRVRLLRLAAAGRWVEGT